MFGLAVFGIECNLTTVRVLVETYNMEIPSALGFITRNVADSHGLKDHGRVGVGAVANALLFDEDFKLTDVFAKGRSMMRSGEILVKGVFET